MNDILPKSTIQNTAERTALSLLDYCRKNDWAGFDPYDALNSRLFISTPLSKIKFCRIVFTQLLKRLPVNLRHVLLVPKVQNAKSIALFLAACVKLSRIGIIDGEQLYSMMLARLTALRAPNTPYWCWGYSFPWQTRSILVPRGHANIVCTSFVANALLDLYETNGDVRVLNMVSSAVEYLLKELYWTQGDFIACFSYPIPSSHVQIHNANFLGAALLCRLYKHSGETSLLKPALKVARFSAAMQQVDGSWRYGDSANQRWVDNFHTGYNLCSLQTISRNTGSPEFNQHIRCGLEFYKNHFFRNDGAPKYFHNRAYPIDIHCVAQSIITMLTLKDLEPHNVSLAHSVFGWAMKHMWDSRGYFYFRVLHLGKNKVSYMRWSQAWMLLALSFLLEDFHQHDN